MNTEELKELNIKSGKIKKLKDNIESTNKSIMSLQDSVSQDERFYRIEIYTYKQLRGSRIENINFPILLGTKEIIRALKDSVSATKGYLHHLEKDFNRR